MSADRIPKSKKGQASLIDILMLGLFISILIVVSIYVSDFSASTKKRVEASYAESMLQSLMRYRNQTFGTFNNTGNMSFAEALDTYFCNSIISESDMNSTAKYLLDLAVSRNYNYIFYTQVNLTSNQQKIVWIWNKQADVCTDFITLIKFNLTLTCAVSDYFTPSLGIWPSWKQIPPKSAC